MTGLAAHALPLLFLMAPPVLLMAGIVLAARTEKECQAVREGRGRAEPATAERLAANQAGPTSGEVFRAMYRLYGRRHLR